MMQLAAAHELTATRNREGMNVPGAVDQGPASHCLLLHPLGRRADRQGECEISLTLPTDTSSFLNRSDPQEGRQLSPGS